MAGTLFVRVDVLDCTGSDPFPGEVLGKGPVYMTNYLAYPVIFWIIAYWLLPAYMNHRVTSAYELL